MAKFLKSIFHPTETRRAVSYDGQASEEDKNSDFHPVEVRRKLSISRSGRMKQAQKKRLSLSMDIYGGEIDIQPVEKPKSVEYHVGQKVPRENPLAKANQRRRSGDSLSSTESGKVILRGQGNLVTVVPVTRQVTEGVIPEAKIPDEEIDSAFEIIDKL